MGGSVYIQPTRECLSPPTPPKGYCPHVAVPPQVRPSGAAAPPRRLRPFFSPLPGQPVVAWPLHVTPGRPTIPQFTKPKTPASSPRAGPVSNPGGPAGAPNRPPPPMPRVSRACFSPGAQPAAEHPPRPPRPNQSSPVKATPTTGIPVPRKASPPSYPQSSKNNCRCPPLPEKSTPQTWWGGPDRSWPFPRPPSVQKPGNALNRPPRQKHCHTYKCAPKACHFCAFHEKVPTAPPRGMGTNPAWRGA